MHTYCLINGEIMKTSEPVLKVNDLGLLRGYGVFDFFPIRQSQPVFISEYWNRFQNSAHKMLLPFYWDRDIFLNQLDELIEKNDIRDGYCRLLLTGGYSIGGFLPDSDPNFMVTTQGPINYPDKNYDPGIKLITLNYCREYPEVKSINYMTVLLERNRLRDEKAEDVLYLSGTKVTESSRSNFFIIDQTGVLKTPKNDVLAGITRSKVLEIAQDIMDVQITDVTIDDIRNAQAAFITSTTKGIMPVRQIENIILPEDHIHPMVHKLRESLNEKIDQFISQKAGHR